MLLTAHPDVARSFCSNYAAYYSFVLSVDLLRGAKVAERRNAITDLATAAFVHHERYHHACL